MVLLLVLDGDYIIGSLALLSARLQVEELDGFGQQKAAALPGPRQMKASAGEHTFKERLHSSERSCPCQCECV
ncbi:hypothetical protein AOLI_G00060100 [Acnodon oligacanthus]